MQQRALVFLRTACNVNSVARTTSFALSTIVSPLFTRMATRPRSPSPGLVSAKHARLSSSTTKSVNTQSSPSSSSNKNKNDENMTVETAQEPFLFVELDANHPNAKEPTRGSALAAGYDLYASEACVIPKAGGRKIVPTGIRLAIPQQCYGRVAPRSGLASKHGIDVGAGVIDADYRGLLGVLLYNFGSEDFHVNIGDRIAQLVLERIMTPKVKTVKTLDETVRGAAGFGSTGGFGAAPPASATTTTNGISEDKSSS